MKNELIQRMHEGLFSNLYNHFLVRYPSCAANASELSDALQVVDGADAQEVLSLLHTHSWEVGRYRSDLAPKVEILWGEISPRERGDYIAGVSEGSRMAEQTCGEMLDFILEQLKEGTDVEWSAISACQLGCNLLTMGEEKAFTRLLQYDVDWRQEIERINPMDAKRWKATHLLSKRVIDVFLEATLILKRPDATQLVLEQGANPNILVWQLERSYNALYTALSYAIHHREALATVALLRFGADVNGSNQVARRSPLPEAFLRGDRCLIAKLMDAGALLDAGATFSETPFPYGRSNPVEWVQENLSDVIEFLPLESKPLFHSPHAQGGWYFTLLELAAADLDLLRFVADQGLDLQPTEYEMATLIHFRKSEALELILDRIAPRKKEAVLARVLANWPEFSSKA